MARFVGLLLIAPCLAVLGWLYWLYVRRRGMRRFDAGVLVVAALAAMFGSILAWQAALGHASPIWKQVAAPIGAYVSFNIVLFAGLVRHWIARSRNPVPVSTPSAAQPDPAARQQHPAVH